MPLRTENPILKVELDSMHTIDTSSGENLYSLWSIFNKISEQIEDGKRLENLSWRLWARESVCYQQEPAFLQSFVFPQRKQQRSSQVAEAVPALSCSVDSTVSSIDEPVAQTTGSTRPELRRTETNDSRRSREKHIAPIDLERIVTSIKEKKELEPLSPLPFPSTTSLAPANTRPEDSTPRLVSSPRHPVFESSTSTIATAPLSPLSDMSPTAGSDTSASSEMSSTSVVHGFTPGKLSTSARSSSNMVLPAPILKNSASRNLPVNAAQPRKAKFTLGGSEGDESSLESRYITQSSIASDNFKPANLRKVTSFKDTVTTYPAMKSAESDSAIESESAIETDDEDESWEDDDEEEDNTTTSNAAEEKDFFHKSEISSRVTHLPSRPSLISMALKDGKSGNPVSLLNSRSTPALRRSRTSTPNGPSLAASPEDETVLEMRGPPISRAQPIIMTTSNTVTAPSTSPRTTRRLMLQQEIPESLRKQMIWERQQRNKTHAAALKRRHTAHGPLKDLQNYPGTTAAEPRYNPSFSNLAEPATGSWNAYFDAGNEQEYHSKGW